MKKLLLIASLLISMIGNAQFQFPETEVNLILNKELKVIPDENSLSKHYRNFYKSLDFDRTNELENNYDMLAGKTFKVTAIDNYNGVTGRQLHKLTLTNPEIGTVYFNYNPSLSFEFPFEIIGGIKMPDGYYCNQFRTVTDKFTGITTTISKPFNGTSFMKTKGATKTTYFLDLSALSPTAVVGKTGVTILLANGKKISKPNAKIDIDANTSGGRNFKYTSMIELTKADIAMLTESPITDARLYIFDTQYKEGIKMMETLKCLIKN